MVVPKFSEFEILLMKSKTEIGSALLLMLGWIVVCDGRIDEHKEQKLRFFASSLGCNDQIDQILRLSNSADINSKRLSAEILKRHAGDEKNFTFIKLALNVALSDGNISVPENYILKFIADLIGFSELDMRTVAGNCLSDPPDLSSADYWIEQERKCNNRNAYSSSRNSEAYRYQGKDKNRIKALAVLGLEMGASIEDIKKAYRNLAQIHHPDRFASLGADAVAKASVTFQRIKEAYEYLNSNA